MIPIPSASSSSLTWSRIRNSRNYEVKLGSEVWGTLKRSGFWSCEFLAQMQGNRWIFRRAGCFRTRAEVVDAETGNRIVSLQSSWGAGGIMAFDDGQTFHLDCKGCLHPVWTLKTVQGQPIMSLQRRENTFQLHGAELVPAARLSLLMMFSLYRVLQTEEDAAALAVVAAS